MKYLRGADKRTCLLAYGFDDCRVRVTQVGAALAAHAINVFLASVVPQPRPLAAHNRDRTLGVHAGLICVFDLSKVRHVNLYGVATDYWLLSTP